MLHEERHEQILAQLKIKHAVKVNTPAKELGASESTIRRAVLRGHRLHQGLC